jgi:hypothetical protein
MVMTPIHFRPLNTPGSQLGIHVPRKRVRRFVVVIVGIKDRVIEAGHRGAIPFGLGLELGLGLRHSSLTEILHPTGGLRRI